MKLPPVVAVKEMLSGLLGRDVGTKPSTKLGPMEVGFVGELVDASGTVRALTFSDRSAAAYVGASLAMIPRGVADDGLRRGAVPENLLENHVEVINIAASLFNAVNTHAEHVKLAKVHATGATLPASVKALWAKPVSRLDLVIDVTGYGAGKLTLVC